MAGSGSSRSCSIYASHPRRRRDLKLRIYNFTNVGGAVHGGGHHINSGGLLPELVLLGEGLLVVVQFGTCEGPQNRKKDHPRPREMETTRSKAGKPQKTPISRPLLIFALISFVIFLISFFVSVFFALISVTLP